MRNCAYIQTYINISVSSLHHGRPQKFSKGGGQAPKRPPPPIRKKRPPPPHMLKKLQKGPHIVKKAPHKEKIVAKRTVATKTLQIAKKMIYQERPSAYSIGVLRGGGQGGLAPPPPPLKLVKV